METTATGSGGFPSLFSCLFSHAGQVTCTANQSAFSHRQVVTNSAWWINHKAVQTLQFTPRRPEMPTLSDGPDKSRPQSSARCVGAFTNTPCVVPSEHNIYSLCVIDLQLSVMSWTPRGEYHYLSLKAKLTEKCGKMRFLCLLHANKNQMATKKHPECCNKCWKSA